ncbi:MAG: RecQ family ATP-dependent DNA helicase [Bacteroidales bacterium]|nr:RecQ family ATP-dependent DNA helicase [Bacteroidales bacterium]
MQQYLDILKKYWGYESFRPVQESIIHSVMEGKDTLGLLPTGGGKSITFQLPALANKGACLVVTPLIALMSDQVNRLLSMGIKAVAIHSGIGRHEMQVVLDNAMYGAYKLIYVSPERLDSDDFRNRLRHTDISFIAVDEAHCISQWGYDFRPSYLRIKAVRDLKPEIPVLALTATATPKVVNDIQLKLGFKGNHVISTSFERKNLVYYVRHSESKYNDLLKIIASVGGAGIIYARSRKKTKEIADLLRREKISADYYHAGLNYEVRTKKQHDWMSGKTRVIAATNAFGMGIDKPDVRFVVHIDFPDSIEEYFQEAGRAGRDNKKAFAVLIAGTRDKMVLNKRIADSFPDTTFIKNVYNAVCNYLKVPIGGGRGIAFDFDLQAFVSAYKLHPVQTFNALKLLEQQGYLTLTDELQNSSRVYFAVDRDDLYRFQVKNSSFDGFIKLVLRSYTGLFTEYVPINEETLAKRAGLTRDMVYQYFVRLAKMNIIKYIPGKKSALLVFTEERMGDKSIFISAENYHYRKERFVKQIEAISNYAFSTTKCRNVILLDYFGDTTATDCGQCDYCRGKTRVFGNEEKAAITNYILSTLKTAPCFPEELAEKAKFDPEWLSETAMNLLNDEKIRYSNEGKLEIAL